MGGGISPRPAEPMESERSHDTFKVQQMHNREHQQLTFSSSHPTIPKLLTEEQEKHQNL
jgi:hypothetical protein